MFVLIGLPHTLWHAGCECAHMCSGAAISRVRAAADRISVHRWLVGRGHATGLAGALETAQMNQQDARGCMTMLENYFSPHLDSMLGINA